MEGWNFEIFLKKKVRDTLFKSIFGTLNVLDLKNSTTNATPNSMNRAIGENWSWNEQDTVTEKLNLQILRPPYWKNDQTCSIFVTLTSQQGEALSKKSIT